MTQRELDRFDKQAREILDNEGNPLGCGHSHPRGVSHLATALRAAESSALERAAQHYELEHAQRRGLHGSLAVAAQLRALIPPAAANAVEKRICVEAHSERNRCEREALPGSMFCGLHKPHAAETGKAHGAEKTQIEALCNLIDRIRDGELHWSHYDRIDWIITD